MCKRRCVCFARRFTVTDNSSSSSIVATAERSVVIYRSTQVVFTFVAIAGLSSATAANASAAAIGNTSSVLYSITLTSLAGKLAIYGIDASDIRMSTQTTINHLAASNTWSVTAVALVSLFDPPSVHQSNLSAASAASSYRHRSLQSSPKDINNPLHNARLKGSESAPDVEVWVTQHSLIKSSFFDTELDAALNLDVSEAWLHKGVRDASRPGTEGSEPNQEVSVQDQRRKRQQRSLQTTASPPASFLYTIQTNGSANKDYSLVNTSSTPFDQTAASLTLFSSLIEELAQSVEDLVVSHQVVK